ncbi:DASS family sodium-coupled anion symporter [Marinomonas ostreistagni]|uniref:DASS family sodium-coupled anion symporter n=1 Tax=Marinomonas ostreistagni TaxID=359209 RepID=A0ABS0Z831_9GAMM|nr:DASS family sodium-coupled anion symporter [Marinomonas ostreistagni]MBJ7549821.1 DASS family sodium-coupled anion symporter [Marinomonas ostreistagni]
MKAGGVKLIPCTTSAVLTLLIWFVIPVPDGVSVNAWQLLALFVGTISAIIGKAMPIGAIAILAIALVALTGVTNNSPSGAMKDALSGFSNSLIWLIGIAIIISRGLSKSGLGNRVGYYFISLFGRKTVGIGYALALSELVIAPVTPSNTARGGGIIHPIMKSIASSFGSQPEDGTARKIGHYLALVNYQINPITSAMFITATAPNPLVVQFIADATGAAISITWGMWALAALLPGLVCIAFVPLLVYLVYPPEIKNTPDARTFAKSKLHEMGPMTFDEKIMVFVFALLLVLWAGIPAMLFGTGFAMNTTAVAFLGLSILLITGVLSWDDVLKEKSAWDTVIWFSALVMMATFLNKLGLVSWFSSLMESNIAQLGFDWPLSVLILVVIYFYAHYFFASTTAHITAMFAAFYAAGLALGAPPLYLGLFLAGASSLMMSLTHYATGTSPIIFGSGYVSMENWWTMGGIMSIVNLTVWGMVGGLWWKVLGFW